MNTNQAKDLFQLQSELVDMKVDMVVSKAIDRVIEKINGLENRMHAEMHKLRHDMNHGFSSLDKRVIAIETKLGMVNETRKEIRTKWIDYSFKAGWLILGAILAFILTHLPTLL